MMMSVEENLQEDELVEILSRLPSRSIARFCCVSKQWASLLVSPYFTKLFLTRSITRPRLLFAVYRYKEFKWLLYSCTQPQKSSLTVTAEFQMSFPETWYLQFSPPQVFGSIYYCKLLNNRGEEKHVICNPSTGHILWLPDKDKSSRSTRRYLGYDPIAKQFSVLSMSEIYSTEFEILNLGCGELFWRSVTCPLQHVPHDTVDYHTVDYPWVTKYNTCINGVLYYTARLRPPTVNKIVCFDLNSEKFDFIDQPGSYVEPIDLVNFKGKLCGIAMKWVMFGSDERFNLDLTLWVLEDFEKQEWSQHLYHMPSELCNKKYEHTSVCVVGVSVTGDIVLSSYSYDTKNPYYIYFFNPEKNTVQEVEVKGFDASSINLVYSFVDYAEDLRTF